MCSAYEKFSYQWDYLSLNEYFIPPQEKWIIEMNNEINIVILDSTFYSSRECYSCSECKIQKQYQHHLLSSLADLFSRANTWVENKRANGLLSDTLIPREDGLPLISSRAPTLNKCVSGCKSQMQTPSLIPRTSYLKMPFKPVSFSNTCTYILYSPKPTTAPSLIP